MPCKMTACKKTACNKMGCNKTASSKMACPTIRCGVSEMPVVGLGTWQSKPGEVGAAVEIALSKGYQHIDCARVRTSADMG